MAAAKRAAFIAEFTAASLIAEGIAGATIAAEDEDEAPFPLTPADDEPDAVEPISALKAAMAAFARSAAATIALF